MLDNDFVRKKLSIILPELTPRLASTAGLRNRLVHRYDEIDNKAVYYSLQPLLRHYRQYERLIEAYLARSKRKRVKTR